MTSKITIDLREIVLFIQDDAMMQELLESVPDGNKHRSKLLAELFGVSRFTINDINFILKNSVPELIDLIKLGKCNQISVNHLFQISKLSPKIQKSIVSGGDNAIRNCTGKTLKEVVSFIDMNSKVNNIVEKNMKEFENALGKDVKKICVVANQIEMWCNKCNWGFDVFLPSPNKASCPYCHSTDVCKRKPYWSPRSE